MNRSDAARTAIRLRRSGFTLEEIATTLDSEGYRSKKTGEPLTISGVAKLLDSERESKEGAFPANLLFSLETVLDSPEFSDLEKVSMSRVLIDVYRYA